MAEPWVVTYEIQYRDRARDMDCRVTDEFYRGSEAECRRIADQSMSPHTWEGQKVTGFQPIIGMVAEWDKFLREWAEMEA